MSRPPPPLALLRWISQKQYIIVIIIIIIVVIIYRNIRDCERYRKKTYACQHRNHHKDKASIYVDSVDIISSAEPPSGYNPVIKVSRVFGKNKNIFSTDSVVFFIIAGV